MIKSMIVDSKIFKTFISPVRQALQWRKRGFSDHSPQFVKQAMFLKHGITDGIWIETGTYKGTTTQFLASKFSKVITIEPSKELYERAVKKFSNKNVELYNDVSENVMSNILSKLNGNINFWLDGHFSEGITFKGKKMCPVEEELTAISDNLERFDKVHILIDDIRLFFSDRVFERVSEQDYPSIDYVTKWAETNNFLWRIENDILILKRQNS